MESWMRIKPVLIVSIFFLVSLSCRLPNTKPVVTSTAQPPVVNLTSAPTLLPTTASSTSSIPTAIPDAPTAAPQSPDNGGTPTTVPGAQASQTGSDFASLDPCKSLTKQVAEKIIGEEVGNIIPAGDANYKSCIVMTASQKSAMFTITNTEMAKKNFINEILQYKKGCDIHYTGGSATATPFPSDGQALMKTPLRELFTNDLKMQAACGGVSKPLPVLGPNAYTVPFLKAGVVGMVQNDMFFTFIYSDIAGTDQDMQNRALDLARIVLNK